MSPVDDAPLRKQIGPYRIVSRIGGSGMGVVFKGWDPRLERDVAIKILHPDAAADADRRRQLLAEGRAASALTHPNILRVYDADVDGGGIGWAINDDIDVFGSYTKAVMAVNTHVLNRGILLGASIRLQKSPSNAASSTSVPGIASRGVRAKRAWR